ncbi:MAG: FAD-dependent thymidylate synthase [Leptolyngbyaceae cyanobacterium RM2_2_4]|nr:FAD-dependent thymidylate synthase [Leptolyngbyaceae cyanobacterium RM2_2_4]
MIEAKIVKDSVAPSGMRLTTFVLTYPRFIHAEFMTHRMFSRNASSSRAIPVKKQIQMIMDNPVVPLAFTKNKAGMQGGEALDGKAAELAEKIWMMGCFHACDKAKMLADLEVHKQYANRLLEPYAHITVVCTATNYSNFFALRLHPAAQPEICELARQMWEVYKSNKPQKLQAGEWHLPFITDEDFSENVEMYAKQADLTLAELQIRRSVARCARVSYLNHEGMTPTIEQDLQLYDRLVGSAPIHASPAEHQGQAIETQHYSGNFRGWVQYRKTLPNENIKRFNGPEET